MTDSLAIQENECFSLENWQVEVLSYLGQFTAGVYSFKVKISSSADSSLTKSELGLLRVGSVESGLSRELQLREVLKDYKMIAELLVSVEKEAVIINSHSSEREVELGEDVESSTVESSDDISDSEPEADYLEEEYYPEKEIAFDAGDRQLILLSYLPEERTTLETWLTADNSQEASLSLAIQVCQFFSYLSQRQWCFTDIIPQLIQIGTPINFFDLTNAYPLNEKLPSGLLGNYCAPELAYGSPLDESMSSYTVGVLLYQAIHQKLPPQDSQIDIPINPIPRLYQILKTCLSPLPEERFLLSQLLSLLLAARNSLRQSKIHWNIASNTTVGLSPTRLDNEDSYGFRQEQISNSKTLILGVVADGMGGMSQGEIASNIAVKTVLEEPVNSEMSSVESWDTWLLNLVEKANESVANEVRDGGTTLSLVLAVERELAIAHVGDSRIYLLRQGEIHQLSEDHSLVAMLVASGQITKEESLEHPDRNVLTKSLGSKRRLSNGYVQTLNRATKGLSTTLETGDILLLCSDGVWDLIANEELAEAFTEGRSLQSAVDTIIERVLERGASDNATILALECRLDKTF